MAFGRKGLDSLPQSTAPALETRHQIVRTQPAGDHRKGNRDWAKLVQIGAGIVIAGLSLRAICSGSSLITPLPEGLSFNVTATGAALGLVWGVYFYMTSSRIEKGAGAALGMFLGAPLLAGGWANMVMWQVADDASFAFSAAPWETASYPVEDFDRASRKAGPFGRYSAEIDPFSVGGNTKIPIPREQYEQFALADEKLCITVRQRRSSSGAVEVMTDGALNLQEPVPADIAPC